MPTTVIDRKRFDWVACGIAMVGALAATVPAALMVIRFVDSTLLLTAVVTAVATAVSGWVYARVAKRGSRPIDDTSCS